MINKEHFDSLPLNIREWSSNPIGGPEPAPKSEPKEDQSEQA